MNKDKIIKEIQNLKEADCCGNCVNYEIYSIEGYGDGECKKYINQTKYNYVKKTNICDSFIRGFPSYS